MRISTKKKEKIFEQILSILYSFSPKPLFTSQIAFEIARDEEFVKKMLVELRRKSLVTEIKKNPKGDIYLKRRRWQLSDNTYNSYKRIVGQSTQRF